MIMELAITDVSMDANFYGYKYWILPIKQFIAEGCLLYTYIT